MKNVDHLIGVAIVWVMCMFTWAIVSLPVTAQTPTVEVEPTVYLHDGASVDFGNASIHVKMIRFREGTVCVLSDSRYSDRGQMECDFSNSSLVHNK